MYYRLEIRQYPSTFNEEQEVACIFREKFNLPTEIINQILGDAEYRCYPIWVMAAMGDTVSCRYLVSSEELHQPKYRQTLGHALRLASRNAHFETVLFLLDLDVDVNVTSFERRNALHEVAAVGHWGIWHSLREAGVERLVRDNKSRCPYDVAIKRGNAHKFRNLDMSMVRRLPKLGYSKVANQWQRSYHQIVLTTLLRDSVTPTKEKYSKLQHLYSKRLYYPLPGQLLEDISSHSRTDLENDANKTYSLEGRKIMNLIETIFYLCIEVNEGKALEFNQSSSLHRIMKIHSYNHVTKTLRKESIGSLWYSVPDSITLHVPWSLYFLRVLRGFNLRSTGPLLISPTT